MTFITFQNGKTFVKTIKNSNYLIDLIIFDLSLLFSYVRFEHSNGIVEILQIVESKWEKESAHISQSRCVQFFRAEVIGLYQDSDHSIVNPNDRINITYP